MIIKQSQDDDSLESLMTMIIRESRDGNPLDDLITMIYWMIS